MSLATLEDAPVADLTAPTKPRTLYDLSAAVLTLEYALGADSLLTPEEKAHAITCYLELAGDLDVKLDNYAALIKELEARAKMRAEEANRLQARANADQRDADALKERLKEHFTTHGLEKVNTKRYTIRLQSNGGKFPMTLTEGLKPEDVPAEFRKVVTTIDTEAIRGELEAGCVLDFAQLHQRGKHIRIG